MADDIIKMVKDKGMKDNIVIMSLNYRLIQYIEEKYSEMETGFVYFFAVGDPGNFAADQLLLEEDAATSTALSRILRAGKKPVIWTVNEEEDMDRFLGEEIYGIITDEVSQLEGRIHSINEKSDKEIIMNLFIKGRIKLPVIDFRI